MDQMNISITDQLAEYVREKVRSGRYNNASEVIRDALRRMEEEDARALRLAAPSTEDVIADLTEVQIESIRNRVRAGIQDIKKGNFQTYEGHDGLRRLIENVKNNSQKDLQQTTSRK
jgi:antitoxin ParD1/3/4